MADKKPPTSTLKVTANIGCKVDDDAARWLAQIAVDAGLKPSPALRELVLWARQNIEPIWKPGLALNQFLRRLRVEQV